ncbi:MAG TPA: sugar O-acetyltransferase [Cellvibrionaceae bacterium]
MSELDKMVSGQQYWINDPELVEIRYKTRDLVDDFNALRARDAELKAATLRNIFSRVGDNVHIEKHLYVDYGINTTIGSNVFINFNFVLLDCCPVTIGSNVFIAPNVQVYAASHPLDLDERKAHIGVAAPITIGSNVWIGGGCIILPGVTIGNGSTIGAGSVVTKSIPDNSVAAGNPCRVMRSQ